MLFGKVVDVQGVHARKLTQEDLIYTGDIIQTKVNQTVKLTFDDQSEVWILPHSKLTVQKYSVVPQKKRLTFF